MLHKIRGLSDRFIYFNDDVLLGAETWPDDFLTEAGAPRIYLAWDVPKCSNECMDTWLGDGTCDQSCNVSACEYDRGDCDGVVEAVATCVEINSSLSHFWATTWPLAPSSGEDPTLPRHRADAASMAWRSTRRFRTNAP